MMGVAGARVDELLDARRARQARRRASACASTRSACASGSGSRTRCSATREVLILDEPANGLDPEGIRWMRGLLRDFADRGGTVLLSSHLLLEVEAVADRLLIIGNGRIVADGSREELLAGAGVLVRATDARRARERARRPPASTHQPSTTAPSSSTPSAEAVGRAALDGGVVLTHLGPSEGAGLETALLRPHGAPA